MTEIMLKMALNDKRHSTEAMISYAKKDKQLFYNWWEKLYDDLCIFIMYGDRYLP